MLHHMTKCLHLVYTFLKSGVNGATNMMTNKLYGFFTLFTPFTPKNVNTLHRNNYIHRESDIRLYSEILGDHFHMLEIVFPV